MANPTNEYNTALGLQRPTATDLDNGVTGSGAVVLAASPALSGSPTAPTPASSDNSTKIATTAFVKGIGITAAGSDTDIQVNSGGVLYADGGFTYNHSTGVVSITGTSSYELSLTNPTAATSISSPLSPSLEFNYNRWDGGTGPSTATSWVFQAGVSNTVGTEAATLFISPIGTGLEQVLVSIEGNLLVNPDILLTGEIIWSNIVLLTALSDGVIGIQNDVSESPIGSGLVLGTGGGSLSGNAAIFSAGTGTTLSVRLGDNSADAPLTSGAFTASGPTTIGGNTIATPFITFAAPTVVPTPSGGSTTYTYTVNALRNNIVIAQSAVGTTTTGPATLDGSDYNTITWLAVPGADHYTVCDTGVPVQSAPVTGLTLNDIGAFTAVSIPSQGGFLYNPYGILIGDPLPDIALVDTPNALYNSLTAVSQLTVALDGAAHSSGVNDTINAGIAVSIFDTNTTGDLAGIIVGVEAINDTTFAVGFWNDVDLTNAPDASAPYGIANFSGVAAGYNNGDATEISCLSTYISNNGTGTVTLANGIHIYQGRNAGTITEVDGILIDDQTAYGGTVTNAYALHIEEQTTATVGSGNWAIKVESNGTDSQVELDGPFILGAATPTVTSGQLGLGTTTGFGNGITSAVTTTLIGTGTGPTNPQTVVNYIKINLGGTDYWMPLVQ